ncbi:MAG: SLC45 family MFS transporter [Armatimonadetes bacterium]|nr:SLC45 family MFS transporter [Armatimonadota bacterium]
MLAESPSECGEPLPKSRLIAMSAFWFAINLHWGALLTIVIPAQVAALAPQAQAQTLAKILGLGAFLALVVTPVAGALSDRCAHRLGRRRPFIAVGTVINVLGLALMLVGSQRADLIWYAAGYLVVQLGNNIATGAYAGLIPDLVPAAQRGEASGFMAAMTQLGMVGGAMGGGLLMAAGQTTACYAIIGATMLVLMVQTLAMVHETPIDPPAEPIHWGRMIRDMWVDPRQFPDFAWVWGTRFLVIAGIWMVQPFLLYYMRDVVGAASPETVTGYMMGIMLLGATVTGWIAGFFSDRVGRKIVVYVANGTLAVAILLLLLSHSLAFTLAIGLLFGLGYGAYYSVDWALACDVLPDQDNAGRYLGVWNIAMVLPQTLAPVIAGELLGHFGQGAAAGRYSLEGYSVVFVLAAVSLAGGAWLLKHVKSAR